jgi:hypothetical protein
MYLEKSCCSTTNQTETPILQRRRERKEERGGEKEEEGEGKGRMEEEKGRREKGKDGWMRMPPSASVESDDSESSTTSWRRCAVDDENTAKKICTMRI